MSESELQKDVNAQDFSMLDREEFMKAAIDATAMPDEMNFHLVSKQSDRGRAFSVEGFEALGYQVHDWVMARTLSFYKRHGQFPAGLRAEVRLVWDDERDSTELARDSDEPWWMANDPGRTPLPADGNHRLRMFLSTREREGK